MGRLNRMKKLTIIALFTLSPVLSAETRYQLDTIEVNDVKGNKDQTSFLESNESISVLKPKNLNRGDLNNSVQMLNGLSNVQTQTDKNGSTFSIRGISDMGVTGYQKDNLASILVDDVFQTPLALKAGSFENWDLESVEVHRGAQSTTQGVNSLAGNILLYHSKPTEQDEGAAKLSAGNFGRKEGAFLINQKVTDKFSVRASYNKEYTDGYIKNKTTRNDKWNAHNKDHFVTDFLYRLSSTEELRLNLKLLRMNRGGSYVQDNYKKFQVAEDQDYKEITNNIQAGLTYTNAISSNLSDKLIIGVSRSDSITKSDEDGTAVNKAGTRVGKDNDQFMSIENQLLYKSKKIKNLLGFHLHQYDLRNKYAMNLMFTTTQMYPVTQENEKTRHTYAIFDSFTYNFTEKHSLILGARFEVVKNQFGADIGIPSTSPYASLAGNHEDTSTNTVILPKIGYNYHNGNYSLGAFYTQGYRTGGLSVNRWKATTNTYDPEKTDNYEVSYKYMREKFLFTMNAFYTKWKDQQVEVIFSNSFDTQVQNASQSELYGAELEASYELENADSLRFNAGYVHTQFLSFKNNSKTYTGNFFPDAATVTSQASYWKVFNDSWKSIVSARYVGKSYTDPDNSRSSPEQFYTDFNTQYNFSSYMVEFYVRNIFDQKYRLLNGAPRSTTSPYQASYHRVNAPRELGARLNYYW